MSDMRTQALLHSVHQLQQQVSKLSSQIEQISGQMVQGQGRTGTGAGTAVVAADTAIPNDLNLNKIDFNTIKKAWTDCKDLVSVLHLYLLYDAQTSYNAVTGKKAVKKIYSTKTAALRSIKLLAEDELVPYSMMRTNSERSK